MHMGEKLSSGPISRVQCPVVHYYFGCHFLEQKTLPALLQLTSATVLTGEHEVTLMVVYTDP